ncbi:MAG: bifunctional diaminohydroxyphosphoribosylaminopyrimidine deaminase/5-amino-6-(5-phosphoribosylamino)uracil reductase RibD [Eubacteriales bacterium]|nr:bifunctional diaminohydroxyphosphoribosylaminopyrimidine deaminase/5-amino-6-(5-phosphoribosylamino)uracil reductase RibD [Eubacteriales bacterium]
MIEEKYMRRAIELAKKGEGWTNPNPLVGAVIEKDGCIIGEGYHEKYGGLHAERNALKNFRKRLEREGSGVSDAYVLRDATMYVTLEPCCHYGKQPPCTEAIIESGIKRVVIGSNDPNPKVSGRGIEILKSRGIEVITGFMKAQCDAINEVFFHYISTKKPLVVMKYAQTLDGKIATYKGKSQWITGEKAREHVHRQRNRYAAIMTGIGTVLADNPMLTCRVQGGNNPVRVICDSSLRIPLDCNIVKTAKDVPTIIATVSDNAKKQAALKEAGCRIIENKSHKEKVDLKSLINELGSQGIDSVYLEGGQTLNWSALEAGIVDNVNVYIAPKIFGGSNSFTSVGGVGVDEPDEAFTIKETNIVKLGNDYMIEGKGVSHVHRNS